MGTSSSVAVDTHTAAGAQVPVRGAVLLPVRPSSTQGAVHDQHLGSVVQGPKVRAGGCEMVI